MRIEKIEWWCGLAGYVVVFLKGEQRWGGLFSLCVILSAHFSIFSTVERTVTLPSYMRDFYDTGLK